MGNPKYIAPEILRGEKYSEESDVYSFGVVIWEILSGKIPRADLTGVQIVGFVGFDDPKESQLLLEDNIPCSKRLKKLMKWCLNHNPRKRPSFEIVVKEIDLIKIDFEQFVQIQKELKGFFG